MGRHGVKYRWVRVNGKSVRVATRRKSGYKFSTDYINTTQAKDCKHVLIVRNREVKCKRCPFGFIFEGHPTLLEK